MKANLTVILGRSAPEVGTFFLLFFCVLAIKYMSDIKTEAAVDLP